MSRPVAELSRSSRARRVRVRVRGTVQGVGFRPFVFGIADELGLDGFVLNDERGVLIEAEGPADTIDRLLGRLRAEAPPLAEIEAIDVDDALPTAERGFRILESERCGEPEALVSPDVATCADCVAELFDPADRRYRYPFINCTNCGPRMTIVRGIPYDRPLTTMAGFEMCPACRSEYEDPADRRFHAQPNACPQCGPRARLTDRDGAQLSVGSGHDPIAAAAELLVAGGIVAIKGIGGFHLACRADDQGAVAALRQRKHREQRAVGADGGEPACGARADRADAGRGGAAREPAAADRDRPSPARRRGRRGGRAAFAPISG